MDQVGAPQGNSKARERLRRMRERAAAQAAAEAGAGTEANPGESAVAGPSTLPSQPTSTTLPASQTLASLTFSSDSSFSGLPYLQPSSSALQLDLPGPMTPLPSRYPYGGLGGDSPISGLPQYSTLGLSTSSQPSIPIAPSSARADSRVGPGGGPVPLPSEVSLTQSERRRILEATGQAIGIEDEIEWADDEETLDKMQGEQVEVMGSLPVKPRSKWNPHGHALTGPDIPAFQILRAEDIEARAKAEAEAAAAAEKKKGKKKEEGQRGLRGLFGRKGKEGQVERMTSPSGTADMDRGSLSQGEHLLVQRGEELI